MIDQIQQQRQDFESRIGQVSTTEHLKQLRTDFIGKKGCVTEALKTMRGLSPEEKREIGKHVNQLKVHVETRIKEKTAELAGALQAIGAGTFDTTLPGRQDPPGTLHPITQVMDEIIAVFTSLGFEVAEGPEIETDHYNFEALNMPKDHPATTRAWFSRLR